MNLPLWTLAYAYSVVLVIGYIMTDLSLAYRLARRCQSRRITLVATVAGILWPVLAAAFLAGLLWHGVLVAGRGFAEWSEVAFDDDRL